MVRVDRTEPPRFRSARIADSDVESGEARSGPGMLDLPALEPSRSAVAIRRRREVTVDGVVGTMLSLIPRVGVRGAGGAGANSGLDTEAGGGTEVASEGRRGMDCLEIGPVGGRKDPAVDGRLRLSCCQGFDVRDEGASASMEGFGGVFGCERCCVMDVRPWGVEGWEVS